MTDKEKSVLVTLSDHSYLYPKQVQRDRWESHVKPFETSGTVLRNLDKKGWIVIFRDSEIVTITAEGQEALRLWQEDTAERDDVSERINDHMSHGSKFNSDLDDWVYEVSLDNGTDEEAGDSGYGPYWAGMMRGGKEIADAIEANDHELSTAQRKKLDGTAGVIMTESTDGFLDVAYFSSKTGLDREWAHVEAELTEDEEDEGE